MAVGRLRDLWQIPLDKVLEQLKATPQDLTVTAACKGTAPWVSAIARVSILEETKWPSARAALARGRPTDTRRVRRGPYPSPHAPFGFLLFGPG